MMFPRSPHPKPEYDSCRHTIFLDGAPDQGRRALSLVPDLHVCVVDLSSVAVGVPEALARLMARWDSRARSAASRGVSA